MASEIATLGGGCFWCLEAAFLDLRGVTSVVSGYAGGSVPNPNYRAVISPKLAKLRQRHRELLAA